MNFENYTRKSLEACNALEQRQGACINTDTLFHR